MVITVNAARVLINERQYTGLVSALLLHRPSPATPGSASGVFLPAGAAEPQGEPGEASTKPVPGGPLWEAVGKGFLHLEDLGGQSEDQEPGSGESWGR